MKCKTATASRSASTSSVRPALIALIALFGALAAEPAAAALSWSDLHGHMGLGYAKLLNSGSPAGSLAIGAGAELPLRSNLSAGVDLGFSLLGSQTFERGSLNADLDYSMFEALLLLHYAPERGPIARISFGPGVHDGDGLPVVVVDEEIYRLLPSLIIGTVDKFAQLTWRGETEGLFGRVSKR